MFSMKDYSCKEINTYQMLVLKSIIDKQLIIIHAKRVDNKNT